MRRSLPPDPIPWPQVQGFVSSLANLTGLRLSVVVPDPAVAPGIEEMFVAGDLGCGGAFRATAEGRKRCRASQATMAEEGLGGKGPAFGLCHARMGQLAVPVRSEGKTIFLLCACGALVSALSEEHKDHLRQEAEETGVRDRRELLRAVGRQEVYSRSRLMRLGEFVRDQLEEKMAISVSLEETTELFLRKYEELMFLYAISENLTPDMEYGKVLSVILDKGLQKLGARSGLFLLVGTEGDDRPYALTAYGDPLLPQAGRIPPAFGEFLAGVQGPQLVERPESLGLPAGKGSLLVYPFRVKNYQTGFLVIAPVPRGRFGEEEQRFLTALANQAATVLHNVHLYREISDLLFSTLEALSSVIDAKDPYTRGHSIRVAEHAVLTARNLGYGPKVLTRMKVAGLLHDFGKVVVSSQILDKSSSLSAGEREDMARHVVVGAQILAKFKAFVDIVPAVRHHHERWDGGGYPDGLAGENIPLQGRIIAVADAFDAMVSSRPYRTRVAEEEAVRELVKNAGTQFDPAVVKAFVETLQARDHGKGKAQAPGR